MKPQVTTLPTGLRILTIPNPNVETVNVMILTSIGGRVESPEVLGIAHFLEHMAFKGTPKRPNPIEINREIELLGARTNAFTWQEFTGYFIMGNKSHSAKYLDILSDIYLNSTFPVNEMEKEKGVILEEIKLHKDEPIYRAGDLFFEATFGKGVLGRSLLGTEETIKGMTRDNFINFKKNYAPKNTLLAVAGNAELSQVLKNLKDLGSWKSQGLSVEEKKENPQSAILLETRQSEQAHLRLGIKTCSMLSSLTPVVDVLNAHIGSGLGSLLFEVLREKLGLAYYCSSSAVYYQDTGVLKMSAGVATAKLEEALVGMIGEIREIIEQGIKPKQLERAKEYIKGGLYMGLETTEGLNEYYAFDLLLKGKLQEPQEYARKIDEVTSEDISKFLKEKFVPQNLSLAVVGNYKNKERLEEIVYGK
ncbi:insulinase family protein [Patescibacteria group bacterium]|nr:insulinase family protein [Patescibacteria group bacterium]